jgi:hypothetical protein
VRATSDRARVVDMRVSPWGRRDGNGFDRKAMRTAAARSPAWMRGGKRREACTAHMAMGEGERGGRKRRERGRGGRRLLKRRQGRKRRGGGLGFGAAWRGKWRRGPGFGDVDRHGMDTVAPGCSDSDGRHTPHGRGERGLRTWEDGSVHDAERRG